MKERDTYTHTSSADIVFSLAHHSSPSRLPVNRISKCKSAGPVSLVCVSKAKCRDELEHISSRDAVIKDFWPITVKLPKAKHYITPGLINKHTPSEAKQSKITLHQTGTYHRHSFSYFLTRPRTLAWIPGQWRNYWVLIVFYEIGKILTYLWT